jgi:hypothetical protein
VGSPIHGRSMSFGMWALPAGRPSPSPKVEQFGPSFRDVVSVVLIVLLVVEEAQRRSDPTRRLASKRVRDDDRLLKRVSKIRVLLV